MRILGCRPSVHVTIYGHETPYIRTLKFGWKCLFDVVIKSTSVTNRKFSVVGVTTRYGVDGPGFNPGGSQTFRAHTRQTQRPTQPSAK